MLQVPSDQPPSAQLLFAKLADDVASLIKQGSLRPGDRLPSVRRLSKDRKVSVATVLSAYERLEHAGLIEAKTKSGHFVRREPTYARVAGEAQCTPRCKPPRLTLAPQRPSVSDGVRRLLDSMRDPMVVPLGAAQMDASLLPIKPLNRILSSIARELSTAGAHYELPEGLAVLRRQLAKRSVIWGAPMAADDFIVTAGAMEGLLLALRATTRPGDTIAIATPTYFGILQLVEEMGLKVIEVPTLPHTGLDLDTLEVALDEAPVRAVVGVTTFDNPMGSLMSDANKERLVRMLEKRDIPFIEDDIYGDLGFDGTRPRPAKSFDRKGLVIYTSSISKTIAAGYRVGWVVGGRYHETIERMKFSQNIATPTLLQMAVAEYFESGAYDRHLRHLRERIAKQVSQYRAEVARSFPAGTWISDPRGGFVLWIELPAQVTGLELQARAFEAGIAVAPGSIFSARQRYASFIRLSCGGEWSPRFEGAIGKLGELVSTLRARAKSPVLSVPSPRGIGG